MARTHKKPRTHKPKRDSEKKKLRMRLDREREPDGECMKCSAAWPQGKKQCPECGWDGIDMSWYGKDPR